MKSDGSVLDKLLNLKDYDEGVAILEDLTPLRRTFVELYLEHRDLDKVAKIMGRTPGWANMLRLTPKVNNAIEYRLKGVHDMPEVQRVPTRLDASTTAMDLVPLEERVKLLWAIAQEGAGKIYDKEGNEIMMNPTVSVAAIKAITDISGEWAPKESHVDVAVRDTRTVSEIKDNVESLMAEYTVLNQKALPDS